MVKHGLAIGVDAAQQRKIMLIPGRNYAVQHYPVATFSKIIFELYYQRYDVWLNLNLLGTGNVPSRQDFSNRQEPCSEAEVMLASYYRRITP